MKYLGAVLLLAAGVCLAQQPHQKRKPGGDPAAAPAPTSYTVENLGVEGNHNYTADQIVAVAGLRVGQKAGTADFDAAREKLEKSGAFDHVSYRYTPSKDGEGYDAVIEVAEVGQVYPVRFENLPVPEAQLRAMLKEKDPLFGDKIPATKPVVDRYVAWIAEYLAGKDYRQALAGRLSADGGEDLAVLFSPAKG